MKPKAKTLATRIADEIFENGFNEKATKLTLYTANGVDLGSWSFSALRDTITAVLKNANKKNSQVITVTWLRSCGWSSVKEYKLKDVLEQTFTANTGETYTLQITMRSEIGNIIHLIHTCGKKRLVTTLPATYTERRHLLSLIEGLSVR